MGLSNRLAFASVPVRRSPAALARRFAQICNAIQAESLEGEDLSPLQYAVLSHLSNEPNIDQNGLAARLAVDRTNIGVLISHLEAKGLVIRRRNGNDRRAWLVRLTGAGARLYSRLSRAAPARQKRMLSALSKHERKLFLDFLVRIISSNEAYVRPGAGRRKPFKRGRT
jgi:DNA-binding MarR family transcriptional regulator